MTSAVGSVDGARAGRAPAQERFLDAVTEIVGCDGYAGLRVERLLAEVGVSRPTFYQYFENVEDCFWSTYRRHAQRLVSALDATAGGDEPRELAVLDTLVARALCSPRVARLLMCEGLAAGPRGQSERDALIAEIGRAMGASAAQARIDLPLAILIGGVFRFLSMRLADGGPLDGLPGEIRQWAEAFAQCSSAQRCSSSQQAWSSRFAPEPLDGPPGPSEETVWVRPVASPREGARPVGSPRERILRATAASVREQGYRAVTVAAIAKAAGVSRRAFYNEFPGKQEAFVAAYEHGFQQTLVACTPTFFAPGPWPERVWRGVRAATRLLAQEPLFAYLGFVESYAVGPVFAARVHDTQLAFTLFLEDGYRQRPQAQSLSRACSVLASTTIFETGFHASRSSRLSIQRMQPLAAYIALAPFLGLDAAGEFVTAKLDNTAPTTGG